jgi:antitoxin (DNA-binding transcriptional repressor) of toxin-antitoxin stability system
MSTIHITEAEAIRDPAAMFAHVRAGAEVIIEDENSTFACLVPRAASVAAPEPGYDEWFRAQVREGLDCDPATDIDGDVVEAEFAERRRLSMLRALEHVG